MTENDIRRRLAGRAAEYRMFMNDEPDTEVAEIGGLSTKSSKLKDDVERLDKVLGKD